MLYTSNIVLKTSSEIFGANTIWKSLKDKVFLKPLMKGLLVEKAREDQNI